MATKLRLNNAFEFGIDGYNRYTNIDGNGNIVSHASVNLTNSEQYDTAELANLTETITDLEILEDNMAIYHLRNQNAKITNISESLISGRIVISMQITFNLNINAQE